MTPPPTSPAQRLASSTLAPRPPPHRFGPHILVSLFTLVLISSYPCVFMSSYPYILISSYPCVFISLCPHILMSLFLHVLTSPYHHFFISAYFRVLMSSCPDILKPQTNLKVRLIFTGHPHPPTQWT